MNLKNIINIINQENNIVLIADFDHTITTFSSETSIGVYSKYLCKEYVNKKNKIDKWVNKTKNKLLIKILWKKKMRLLKKYYNKEKINNITDEFKIRNEFVQIINYCKNNSIPFIICSSGHKEVIDLILKHNKIYYDKLIANQFDNSFSNVITPYNKFKFIKNKNKAIVIGDQIGDSEMVKGAKITIGIANNENYNNMKKYFDYIIIGDE